MSTPKHIFATQKNFFFVTQNKIYAKGNNEYGQLGIGFKSPHPVNEPIIVHYLKGDKIIKIASSGFSTVFLDEKGIVFISGHHPSLGQEVTEPLKLDIKEKVIDIACSTNFILLLTNKNSWKVNILYAFNLNTTCERFYTNCTSIFADKFNAYGMNPGKELFAFGFKDLTAQNMFDLKRNKPQTTLLETTVDSASCCNPFFVISKFTSIVLVTFSNNDHTKYSKNFHCNKEEIKYTKAIRKTSCGNNFYLILFKDGSLMKEMIPRDSMQDKQKILKSQDNSEIIDIEASGDKYYVLTRLGFIYEITHQGPIKLNKSPINLTQRSLLGCYKKGIFSDLKITLLSSTEEKMT